MADASCFVVNDPLCNLQPDMVDFLPCDRVTKKLIDLVLFLSAVYPERKRRVTRE